MSTLHKLRLLLVALLLPAGAAPAADIPGDQDIASLLAAPKTQAPSTGAQTRSYCVDTSRGVCIKNPVPDPPAAVDLNVNFEFNSAKLTPEGSVLVGNLGRALKDPRLVGKRFRIEGHTDGKGSEAYNQVLSERRADVVRQELMALHAADGARIETRGFGKSRLLDGIDPEASANRRVRVVNLGAQ